MEFKDAVTEAMAANPITEKQAAAFAFHVARKRGMYAAQDGQKPEDDQRQHPETPE